MASKFNGIKSPISEINSNKKSSKNKKKKKTDEFKQEY